MNQLVSVVTLTYKKFDKLFETIDSVLSQDYSPMEYIISDDGSDDFPEDRIRKYIESRRKSNIVNISIIPHETNQGTVKNLNDAYRHTNGSILIPISADDSFMSSNVVSRIVKVYEERGCEVLSIGRALYDSKGNFVRNIPSKKEGKVLASLKGNKDQYQRFITGRFFEAYSGCTLSMKKSFIEHWGYFDERYLLLEDGPFFAQYLWENYLECDFDIVGVRYNDGGVSSGKKHPLLLKDDKTFQKTDKVEHLGELTVIQRGIVKYNLQRSADLSCKGRTKAAIMHPIGFIAIKAYRVELRFLHD